MTRDQWIAHLLEKVQERTDPAHSTDPSVRALTPLDPARGLEYIKHIAMALGGYEPDADALNQHQLHQRADDVLCAILLHYGHAELVTIFRALPKGYA